MKIRKFNIISIRSGFSTLSKSAAYSNTMETTIYLSKDARHRGIGKLLMERLIELCRQDGYRVLIACITGNNTESIEFHKGLGFTHASNFHNVGFKHGMTVGERQN